MEEMTVKKTLEFDLPIYEDDRIKKINKELKSDFKTFDEAMKDMLGTIYKTVHEVGDQGGWYIGDGINIRVTIEYDEENK